MSSSWRALLSGTIRLRGAAGVRIVASMERTRTTGRLAHTIREIIEWYDREAVFRNARPAMQVIGLYFSVLRALTGRLSPRGPLLIGAGKCAQLRPRVSPSFWPTGARATRT